MITIKKTIILIFAISTIMHGVSCEQRPARIDEKIAVAVSIFPLYDITRSITGTRADIFYVIPIGADPHTFEPLPSEIKKIQSCTLFIGIHDEFDGWIRNFLTNKTRCTFLHEPFRNKRAKKNFENNPHIWLTLSGAETISLSITQFMSEIDPENALYYKQNCAAYRKELKELDDTIRILFENVPRKKFIQWHPAWNFFAEDYGLEIVGTIEKGHGDEPSVKAFKNLIVKARKEDISVVVIGLRTESKITATFSREIGSKLVRLDGIGDPHSEERSTYLKLMYYNARVLSSALSK